MKKTTRFFFLLNSITLSVMSYIFYVLLKQYINSGALNLFVIYVLILLSVTTLACGIISLTIAITGNLGIYIQIREVLE